MPESVDLTKLALPDLLLRKASLQKMLRDTEDQIHAIMFPTPPTLRPVA